MESSLVPVGISMSSTWKSSVLRPCRKTSVTADFRTEEGRETVRRLASEADILLENFKVGGLAKCGLDYGSLSALNPRLIYCSITASGRTAPMPPARDTTS